MAGRPVGDFDYNTSTAQLGLGLGLSLAIFECIYDIEALFQERHLKTDLIRRFITSFGQIQRLSKTIFEDVSSVIGKKIHGIKK